MPDTWFDLISGPELQQGDIICQCPVPVIPHDWSPNLTSSIAEGPTNPPLEVDIETYNVIVLSQSCDLVNRKLQSVLVCPFWPIEQLPDLTHDEKLKSEAKRLRSISNSIRQGYLPRFHMLQACVLPQHEQPITVVDFWTVYTVPFDFLESFAANSGERLRLLSPYVEHLSQAFARFIMRVGLPAPIAEFT